MVVVVAACCSQQQSAFPSAVGSTPRLSPAGAATTTTAVPNAIGDLDIEKLPPPMRQRYMEEKRAGRTASDREG
uniref:MIP22289p n=1 Tax=Drosophila melanogaster TaxID=7227 RepID=D5SHQ1_DROME|nr:MIP22289p [Drosophila melanogaster]